MNETSYLENLARRIESAARLPNNKAKLFAIADDVRRYKEKKYDGSVDLEAEAMLRGEIVPESLMREAEVELGCEPGELGGTF